MDPSFNIEEVSELIARLVPRLKGDAAGFVTHHEIVSGVLADAQGASIVTSPETPGRTRGRMTAPLPPTWLRGFRSRSPTVSPWATYFDREKRGDVWAYRPKSVAPGR